MQEEPERRREADDRRQAARDGGARATRRRGEDGAAAGERLAWRLRAGKWYWVDKRPVVRRERKTLRRNKELSDRIYAELQDDPSFWLRV